jgi:hypothetical protein
LNELRHFIAVALPALDAAGDTDQYGTPSHGAGSRCS